MWKKRTTIGFLLVAACSLASVLAREPEEGPVATVTKVRARVPDEEASHPIVMPAMARTIACSSDKQSDRPIIPRVERAIASTPPEEAPSPIILTATRESVFVPSVRPARPILPPPAPLALASLPETVDPAPVQAPTAVPQEGNDYPASYVLEGPEPDTVYDSGARSQCNCQNCRSGTSSACRTGCVRRWWLTEAKPCLQESHWGYADQFETRPFGSYAVATLDKQIVNGAIARLALYHYDFGDVTLKDPSILNLRGRKRLGELAGMMVQNNLHPLIIQSSPGKPELDMARLAHVLDLTAGLESPLPAEWVVVGEPIPPPLSGEEATIAQENLLRQTQSGQPPDLESVSGIGRSSGGGGGSGGSGGR